MRNPYLYRGMAGLLILALGVYLFVDRWLMPRSTRQHTVLAVPDLIGQPIDEALELLAEHTFELGDTLRLFDPDFESSQRQYVIGQNPRPGAQAKPGRRVYLYLPQGISQEVLVPDVAGESPRNARARIESIGLVVSGVVPDTIPSYLDGPVTRADPPAGTQLTRGDSVMVFYGTGPDEGLLVEVPNLMGLSFSQARIRLQALQLSGSVLDLAIEDSLAESTLIRRQSPEAGTMVPAGSRIRLYTAR